MVHKLVQTSKCTCKLLPFFHFYKIKQNCKRSGSWGKPGTKPQTLFAALGGASVAKSKGIGVTRHPMYLLTRYAKRLLLKSSQGKTIKIKRIVNVKV